LIKIGITGGKGLLGLLLKKKLKKEKIKISSFNGNIKSKVQIKKWLNLNPNIDYIFHLAAVSSPKEVNKDKIDAFEVNVKGTLNIINIIEEKKKKILMFFPSSSHVYKYSKKKIKENFIKKPSSYYGKTKLAAEELIKKKKSKYLSFFIGRIFSVYHIKQKKPFLFPSVKEKIALNRKNKLFIKNGYCVRDFINAEEVVEILFKIYIKKITGIFNIGSGKGLTVKSFVQKEFNIQNLASSDRIKNSLVSNNNKLKLKLKQSNAKI
jgi:UDP-glucose 4-epimerase